MTKDMCSAFLSRGLRSLDQRGNFEPPTIENVSYMPTFVRPAFG